jgi:multimeric flavodoxin WrbA
MEKRKVVIVMGSPRRNGNSAALAQRAAAGVMETGGEVESFYLHEMNIHPCTACDSCQKDEDSLCVIEDDMQLLYPRVRAADGLIIASPVYWFTVSAQTKLFIDRCYAFGSPRGNFLKGKGIGIILTYGDVDPFSSGAVNAIRTFQDAFGYIGAPIFGIVYGSAFTEGEIKKDRALMEKAYQLGKRMASG